MEINVFFAVDFCNKFVILNKDLCVNNVLFKCVINIYNIYVFAAYDCAHIVPWYHGKTFYLKIVFTVERTNLLQVKKRPKIAVMTFVTTILLVSFSKDSFTGFIPSAFAILMYKDLTSRDNK